MAPRIECRATRDVDGVPSLRLKRGDSPPVTLDVTIHDADLFAAVR